MPNPSPEFFFLRGDQRHDAEAHAPLLAERAGAVALELAAIRRSVQDGRPIEEAAELYASPATLAELRRQGQLS